MSRSNEDYHERAIELANKRLQTMVGGQTSGYRIINTVHQNGPEGRGEATINVVSEVWGDGSTDQYLIQVIVGTHPSTKENDRVHEVIRLPEEKHI